MLLCRDFDLNKLLYVLCVLLLRTSHSSARRVHTKSFKIYQLSDFHAVLSGADGRRKQQRHNKHFLSGKSKIVRDQK